MNKILLNEPLTKWLLLKRRHSVYRGLLKPNSRTSIRAWHKKFMETEVAGQEHLSKNIDPAFVINFYLRILPL